MRSIGFIGFVALLMWLCAGQARAEAVSSQNVRAELHASHTAIAAGERFTVALHLKMREGWHTYWRSPGDAGEPTRVQSWVLPTGFHAGEIIWPAPQAFNAGTADFPITSYGFSGEVLLPIEMEAPASLQTGGGTLQAEVYWLECADVCIPEQHTLTLPIRFGVNELDRTWAPRIAAVVAAAPHREASEARYSGAPPHLVLTLKAPRWERAQVRNPRFFPFRTDVLEHSAVGPWSTENGQIALELTAQSNAAPDGAGLAGVLALERRGSDGAWRPEFIEIEAEPGETLFPVGKLLGQGQAPLGASPAPPVGGLWAALGFAFLGGLILNFMPCVFPVLSIKVLSFASAPAAHVRRHGMLFVAGVLATFLSLAGLLIALQHAGAAVGWGFQLQQPAVVSALLLVFFVIGLNLIGAFEFGAGLQGLGGSLAANSGDFGAFMTGALAVVAASPCTAPFMGAALGFAAVQPPVVSLSVFGALGLGFATPFAALAFAPGARRLLPRPGLWMTRFKEILAFPMFATAIYLFWVLSQQVGPGQQAGVLLGALCIAFATWLARLTPRGGAILGMASGVGLVVLMAMSTPNAGAERRSPEIAQEATEAVPWSEAALANARASGKPVFVNFTAAWCVTCKANEALVLRQPRVLDAFKAAGVVTMTGDWTSQDAAIAAELRRHGRQGVPLYLLYVPGAETPLVLPQQLTVDAVIGPLKNLDKA